MNKLLTISPFVLAVFLASLCSAAESWARPLHDLPASEIKARIDAQEDWPNAPEGFAEFARLMDTNVWACKKLAEEYFSGTAEDRMRLATANCQHPVGNTSYEIVRTDSLQYVEVTPPAGQDMSVAWIKKQVEGNWRGVFVVEPKDGTLQQREKYVFTYSKEGDKRVISQIEKDVNYDPVKEEQDLKNQEVDKYFGRVMRGSREDVLKLLPPGEYEYLNATILSPNGVSVERTDAGAAPPDVQDGAVENYRVAVGLVLRHDAPLFWTAERLLLEAQKRGENITVTNCVRDEPFAEEMEQRVAASKFIVAYFAEPEKREERWAKVENSNMAQLPDKAFSIVKWQALPLSIREHKRVVLGDVIMPGDTGKGKIWATESDLLGEDLKQREMKCSLVVVESSDRADGFMVLFIHCE